MKLPFVLLLLFLLGHTILANPKRKKTLTEGLPSENGSSETSTEPKAFGPKSRISRPKGWEPEVCDNSRRGLVVDELNSMDEHDEIEFYPDPHFSEEETLSSLVNQTKHNILDAIPYTANHRQLVQRAFTRIAWPNSEIPYEIDVNFVPSERKTILAAIKHIEDRTCLRFPAKNKFHSNSLKILKREAGCGARMNPPGSYSWDILLEKGCMANYIIVHEILHVAGFHHEHLRKDRDDYITILWDNIPEKWWQGYCKLDNIDTGHPYDYVSVLHYFNARDGPPFFDSHGHTLANFKGMSQGDVDQVNYVYCRDGRPKNSCPGGFFRAGGSWQCYKLFNDRYRQWNQAKSKCEAEKLDLAEPLNPVAVRSHLVKALGNERWVHIGARGDGAAIRWLSNGQEISKNSALWSPGQPAYVNTDACLQLMSHSPHLESSPNQPFFMGPCTWYQYTLCEIGAI